MSAANLDTLFTFGLAGVGAFGSVVLFRWAPRTLAVVWCITLFFVPIWLGVQAGVFFSVLTGVTLLILTSAHWSELKLSHVDLLMAGLVALLTVASSMGWIVSGHLVIVLLGWFLPFLAGRLLPTRVGLTSIYSILAAGATAAAVLAIVEFLTGHNFFVQLASGNGLYATWGPLQFRGGLLRSEGAFGHSIALGASLAMSSVFILVARWPAWTRLMSLLIVASAVGLTFSRIGVIGLVLTLAGSLALLRGFFSKQFLTATILIMTGLALLGVPQLIQVFTSAGQEAAGSAAYRTDLYSLLPDLAALGISGSRSVLGNGETYYGQFQSVDSELILTGLRFGYLPLLLAIAALISCLVSVVRRHATPAAIAILAQVPAFATVALITQYAIYVWFLAGLAVAAYQASLDGPPETRSRIKQVQLHEEAK